MIFPWLVERQVRDLLTPAGASTVALIMRASPRGMEAPWWSRVMVMGGWGGCGAVYCDHTVGSMVSIL